MTEESTSPTGADAFEQLQILLDSIEQHPDEQVRNHVKALAFTLLDLHHAALQRMIELLAARPDGGDVLAELGRDDLVKAVLMVHELLPQSSESRLEIALSEAKENLAPYEANVELVGMTNGVAKLRLIGSAKTANVSTAILTSEIEQVLHRAVPDLLGVEYEETIAVPKPTKLVQIGPRPSVQNGDTNGNVMIPIIRLDELPSNELRVVETGGINIMLYNAAGNVYAFENRCTDGDVSLEKSIIEEGVLTCPCHGSQYDLRHGGRCLSDSNLRLESLPVRIESEVVKVAFAQGALI